MQHTALRGMTLLRGMLPFFIALVTTMTSFAQQTFPVVGSLQINTPYPAYWADYAAKMQLNLTMNPTDAASENVRLKLYIEKGSTLIAASSEVISGAETVNLVPSIAKQLTGTQLAPYFRFENLTGLTATQYQQPLEEGLYRFTFEVVNAVSGLRMSAPISQTVYVTVTLYDPPQLLMPFDKEQLVPSSSGSYNFTWQAKAKPPMGISYEWKLVQVPTGATDLNALFANPIKTIEAATSTSVSHGAGSLVTGKTYAWRVRANPIAGNPPFKNNGYSDIYTFKVGSSCPAITNLTAQTKSEDMIGATWTGSNQHSSYKVSYKKGTSGTQFEWVIQNTNTTFINITGLEPSTAYSIKVEAICPSGDVGYSIQTTATTLAKGQTQGVTCGNVPTVNTTGTLSSLAVGNVVVAADFPVTITEAQLIGNNSYKGTGYVGVPWIAVGPKIKVSFDNIQVKDDVLAGLPVKRLVNNGYFQTVYDPNWGGIFDIDSYLEGGSAVGVIRTGLSTTDHSVNFAVSGTGSFQVTPNSNGGATIIVAGSNGQSQTITVTKLPTTIKDANGNIYVVNANGTVTSAGRNITMNMTAAELNTLSPDKGTVTFSQGDKAIYAFDAYNSAYANDIFWKAKYETIGSYGVGRKAIAPNKPDVIKATVDLKDATWQPNNVKFITAKGTQYESKSLGNGVYEITVIGGAAGDGQELYALYPKPDGKYWSLGKVAIFSYAPQKRKLVLIPVNDATTDPSVISQKLNEIFNPICIEWEVTQEAVFRNSSWDANGDGLDVDGSGWFSSYTSEMKSLNQSYAAMRTVNKEAAYLFVLKKAAGGTTAGDMPRGKQFGYLFTDNPEDISITTAHELAMSSPISKHTLFIYI